MIFDSTTIENDPFLVEMRQQLNEMESVLIKLGHAWTTDPSDVQSRIKYDAEWYRMDALKTKYENTIKAVLGL